jgi:hypothetical protein
VLIALRQKKLPAKAQHFLVLLSEPQGSWMVTR